MTKFEEEVKRPVFGIGQSSIKPALGKAVEFYTDKVKEYHNAFSDMNKYIDVIESALDKKDEEIIGLKSQLQQQALPVVPECVGSYIEECKEDGVCLFGIFADASRVEHDVPDLVYFWLGDEGNNDELFARAWLDGYTVEKPQLFYLKNKMTDDFLCTNSGKFSEREKNSMSWRLLKKSFTKAEIESMETGSYELVPVEDGE
ncbi:DUF1642 domain-containing protein [Lactococcus lactis]|uniref:DUF1642 domain-containing protein n=1 Tax=Lactococcus lactis TaxID=1358 RepID=A0AAP3Z0H1_9LACT|nr:DUF1642 domain-containing protein [Lactococcus lactis]MDG4976094.1 DUF1642 domain-containing protein [Lactococcus lactis]